MKNKTPLEKAKEIIKDNFYRGDCGLFNCSNSVGDYMTILYCDENLRIEICYDYSYFEVFGLSDDDFDKLNKYYNDIQYFCNNGDNVLL